MCEEIGDLYTLSLKFMSDKKQPILEQEEYPVEKFGNKPLDQYSPKEAADLLHFLMQGDNEAEGILFSEPDSARALINLVIRANVGLVSMSARCFKDADQIERFAEGTMDLPVAISKAAHLAGGCPECNRKFEAISRAIQPLQEELEGVARKFAVAVVDGSPVTGVLREKLKECVKELEKGGRKAAAENEDGKKFPIS